MCQFLICDCWWHNCCGLCGGWYHAACCCSAWLCMPDEMTQIDPDCCKIGWCLGYGYNHCCWGNVCCVTDSFRTYSGVVTMGGNVMSVNSGQACSHSILCIEKLWYYLKFIYVNLWITISKSIRPSMSLRKRELNWRAFRSI